jgi:hypothetical protein
MRKAEMVMTEDTNYLPAKNSRSDSPMPPTHTKLVSELVRRLLNHYWTADDHPAMRREQGADWIEDLVEFPVECIDEACREWRRTQNKRPTPADIRALAAADQQRRAERQKLVALPPPQLTYAQIVQRIDEQFRSEDWMTCWWGDVRVIREQHVDDHNYP